MRLNKAIYITCAITSISSLLAYTSPPQLLTVNTTNAQTPSLIPTKSLLDALSIIGVPLSDIESLQSTGEANSNIVSLFTEYANNSDKTIYNTLSQEQANALILFGFKLKNQNKITSKPLNTLMVAEKKRLGLSSANVKTLTTLSLALEDNPSYGLTADDVSFVREMLPFIEENPFAFADVLGLLIRAFIVQEDSDTPIDPTVDDDIEIALTNAAQTLTDLDDDQIVNITNIANTYQTTEEFDNSESNVADLSAAMAIAAIPFGVYALYPLIGSENVYAVDNITRNYEGNFNRDYVNRYNGEVNRNRGDFPRADGRNPENRGNINNRGPVDRGAAGRGPAERGAAGRGPAERGAAGNREAGRGPNNGNIGNRGQNGGRTRSLDRSRIQGGGGQRAGGNRANAGRASGNRAGGGRAGGNRGGGGRAGGGGGRR